MFMMAECFRCHKVVGFNPNKVPTVRDSKGVKQPLCAACLAYIQTCQRELNLTVWEDALPGAYESTNVDYEDESGSFYE